MSTKTEFRLPVEMRETARIIRELDTTAIAVWAEPIITASQKEGFDRILFTGEGSSRLFPAKRALYQINMRGGGIKAFTEGATQAEEYDLSKTIVLGISNSGRTKELIRLFKSLPQHPHLYGITAGVGSLLEAHSRSTYLLSCGKEEAVAATKSVVEQALVLQVLVSLFAGISEESLKQDLSRLADAFEAVLDQKIDAEIVHAFAAAPMIYIAGRNTGVAEELTLKSNEITRKKSVFLEGTYALHGVEEVMDSREAILLVEPFAAEEENFESVLGKGLGAYQAAISSRDTRFPTVKIPKLPGWQQYLEIAAGWKLLLEVGLELGIDLDRPARARKVGNEFVSQ